MVAFKGRSGPIIKTVTRTVSDIIFDSIEDTKIDYTNYYYEPTKNSNPYFFDEFKTGTPFYAIRSSMAWNNLELDIENTHYTLNSVIRNPSGWYTKFDRPPVETYISLFDTVYPGKFSNIDNLDIDKRPAQTIVLSGNNILDEARVTATKPFKHFHGNWNGTAINANSAFHFSLSKQDLGQNNDTILTVYVYRSVVSYETAIDDLNQFYSKISSTKVAEYDFSCTGDPYWQQKTINLQNLDIPDGDCLLWFEIVRKPSFSAETFNYPWNLEEINRTWYNYSHDARRDPSNPVYPSLQSSTTGWNIDTGNNTIQANLDPNRASIGFVSGQEYEDYIFESVVKSSSEDDDAIGLVIGFVWENGHEYTLTAYRSQGGPLSSKTWFVVANAGNAVDISGTNFSSLGSPLHYDVWDNSLSVLDTAHGWGSSPNGTKIRIEKTGNQVKVYTSQMNDIDIDLNTEIVINLTGHNARFQRSNIGFASWGQPMAHFHNIYLNNSMPSISIQDVEIGRKYELLDPILSPEFSLEDPTEILSWYRFSHMPSSGYPARATDAAAWFYNTTTSSIEIPLNTSSYTGFISPDPTTSYILESDLSSIQGDDDGLSVIIAFTTNGLGQSDPLYREYTLSAVRTAGGVVPMGGWGVVYNYRQSDELVIDSITVPHAAGWDTLGIAKIKIVKEANIVTATTNQVGASALDPATEIIIDLDSHVDLQKFVGSVKVGVGAYSQGGASFSNINVNFTDNANFQNMGWVVGSTGAIVTQMPATDLVATVREIPADVGVGGFGLEQSNKQEYFANPKGNRYFIEEYHHEKFIDETSSNIIIESFNSHDSTLSAFEEISNKSLYKIENIFISKQSVLLTITGNDYTENGTIGNWKPEKFLQTSTSTYLETNPFLEYQPGIPLKNWGGLKSIDISRENQQISFQGITYNFESSSGYISDGSELIRQESYFSWHMQSFDPFNLDYKTELSRATHYSSPATHDVFQDSNGLFSVRSIARSPERLLQFGPPTDIAKPISKFGLGNPKNNFYKNNQFFDLLSNHDYKDDKFIEITKNTSLGEIVWKETIKVLSFDFSKTAYFEYHKPIELSLNVFYTPVLDKPFIHKVFFVNFETKKLNFKPFIQSPDTSYLIEQNYLHTMISTAKGSKNKFKHLMIEELYRPGYRNLDQVYEFVMQQFEVVSSVQFDYKKFGYTFYEPITTKRPGLSGGSNAFGHDLLTIDKRQDIASNFKTFSMDEMIENSFGAAGRAGRHRDNEYREIHILDRYEYTSIDYDLETHTTYDPDAPEDIEDETFNWVYTIDDDPNNGRIPECLKLEGSRIIGEFTDTDKFLRQYSWETWMKTQGTTDDSGNFVPLRDTLDFDYADFDLIPLRQWEVNITGKSITKGTIDLVYDGVELTTGDVMTQTIGGVESRFEIVRKILEFDKVSDRSTGSLSYEVIHRYEVENIRGDIEITTLEETFTETFVSGESVLQSEKTRAQEELLFSTGIRKSILQKKIEDLTNTIAENLITNPTGYGFISKIPSGKQIDINYVTNEENDSFLVDDFVQIGAGSVSKFIKIIFKIRNNWSFDRDLMLFTDDSIVDTEFSTRTEWVNAQRENNRAVWIPSINNAELDLALVEFIKNYDIGAISIDDFISERDFIIDSRDFSTPDQKTEYKEFLDTIIFINLKSGEWEKDVNIINTLAGDHISNLFPITDSKDRGERFDTISQTENGEQVYKLNCSVNVDEQTFYDNIDTVQVIRGYPIYASCN